MRALSRGRRRVRSGVLRRAAREALRADARTPGPGPPLRSCLYELAGSLSPLDSWVSAALTAAACCTSLMVSALAELALWLLASVAIFCSLSPTLFRAPTSLSRVGLNCAGGVSWESLVACPFAFAARPWNSVASWASVFLAAPVSELARLVPSRRNCVRSATNAALNAAVLPPAVELLVVAAGLEEVAAGLEDVVAGAAELVVLAELDDDDELLLPHPARAIPRTTAAAIKGRFLKATSPRVELCAGVGGDAVRRGGPPSIGQNPAWASVAVGGMVTPMADDEPDTAELMRRQLDQERLEREQLSGAGSDADADRHLRRADKARYLRRKLEQREKSERDAGPDEG
jgi:hypothetical protein